MIIIGLGFVFMACLIFGEAGSYFRNVGRSASKLFFSTMIDTQYSTFEGTTNEKVLSMMFFIVFLFLFNFILMKTLITIVIVRYRTIRSYKLLEIQAHSKLIEMDTKKVRRKWLDFL